MPYSQQIILAAIDAVLYVFVFKVCSHAYRGYPNQFGIPWWV